MTGASSASEGVRADSPWWATDSTATPMTEETLRSAFAQMEAAEDHQLHEAAEAMRQFYDLVDVRLRDHPEVKAMAQVVWYSHRGQPIHPKQHERLQRRYDELVAALDDEPDEKAAQ